MPKPLPNSTEVLKSWKDRVDQLKNDLAEAEMIYKGLLTENHKVVRENNIEAAQKLTPARAEKLQLIAQDNVIVAQRHYTKQHKIYRLPNTDIGRMTESMFDTFHLAGYIKAEVVDKTSYYPHTRYVISESGKAALKAYQEKKAGK